MDDAKDIRMTLTHNSISSGVIRNQLLQNYYLGITATNALSVGSEGSHQVGGGEEAVLVSVHDTEGLLELLDSRVGERFEDVSFLRHLGFCWVMLVISNLPRRKGYCIPCFYFVEMIIGLAKTVVHSFDRSHKINCSHLRVSPLLLLQP